MCIYMYEGLYCIALLHGFNALSYEWIQMYKFLTQKSFTDTLSLSTSRLQVGSNICNYISSIEMLNFSARRVFTLLTYLSYFF